MRLIDSHCHVQALDPAERDKALDRARKRGVEGFLVPATRLDEVDAILDLCHRHQDVWCALGVHPHEASTWSERDEDRLEALAADPKVVAIGECGLDFHYDHSPRDVQKDVLIAQWKLALALHMPVVVHNRDSDQKMLDLLCEPRFADLRGDFHSFAGSGELLSALLERGFYVGVTGMVTFKSGDNIRAQLARIPLDRLLVETDTPYLAPVPHRGKTNQPAWVVEVATSAAESLGIPLTELATQTTANFSRLFAVSPA